ncbi:helix-turn-helix domain-containing protein [Lawsonibacter sp. OA9]|uniref:helix-turn-helix domain-containing protein n=1 Tax=Lawsonibacter sp. OA9 TaxID=2914163 RepID=UPI001F05CD20|nr:helix-turn-helix transcriptional regulator [Lawsonibacter sp. OA9]
MECLIFLNFFKITDCFYYQFTTATQNSGASARYSQQVHNRRKERTLPSGAISFRLYLMIKPSFIEIDAEIWYNNINKIYAEVKIVSVSYSKLWKMLIDKKMSKADLRKAAGLAPNTMTKLRRDEEVKLSILCRICAMLHVNFGDIIDFVPSDAEKENRDIIAETE